MPGRDGTGPLGAGTMTGRAAGLCPGANAWYGAGIGLGLAHRRGCGRSFAPVATPVPTKERLQAQQVRLRQRLAAIEQQLAKE